MVQGNLQRDRTQALILLALGPMGITSYWGFHRIVTYCEKGQFYPEVFADSTWLYWLVLVGTSVLAGIGNSLLLLFFSKAQQRDYVGGTFTLVRIGPRSVGYAISHTFVLVILATVFSTLDLTLLNVWDVLFLLIFLALYYIGCFLYYYFAIPLKEWLSVDSKVRLEQLKLEYDEQRMWLRTFLWLTVSFFVSQVFVVLKTKFEPYLRDPDSFRHLEPVMAANAAQIAILVFVVWSIILSQILRRMEFAKIELKNLKL